MRSLFYRNLTVIDFAYFDSKRGIVGHSLWVDVELNGDTTEEEVIYDFSYAKKKIKTLIDQICDHRFLVSESMARDVSGQMYFDLKSESGDIKYECPKEGACLLPFKVFDPQNLASFLEEKILCELPDNIKKITLSLNSEELKEGQSYFHYTHGLKTHYGNCQRLFHGHKNIVEVFVNHKKDKALESYLSDELFHKSIHFIFEENLIDESENRFVISYKSQQGLFKAELEKHMCWVMKTETTVENLAQEFFELLKEKVNSGDHLRVVAYEGIGKGSVFAQIVS